MMSLRNKCVLVTGAGSFIGSHLCRALHTQGARVIGFVKNTNAFTQHTTEQHVVDISDRLRLGQLVKNTRPDLVVHLAGNKNRGLGSAEYRAGYEINLLGTLNLAEACQELTTLSRFIFLGTSEEYGRLPVPFEESFREAPINAYGVTKLAAIQFLQALVQAHGFPAVILRPSIVYGPRQDVDMFLPALIKTLISGKQFEMTRGEQTRDFLFIDDMVNAILHALNAPGVEGQVINISSAKPVRIDHLAKKVAQLIGPGTENLLNFGARDYRPGETMNYWSNNVRAQELLNWSPTISLEEGLRQTILYYRTVTLAN